MPCQGLLPGGAAPLDGRAPGDGVHAQRLAVQADLRAFSARSVSQCVCLGSEFYRANEQQPAGTW